MLNSILDYLYMKRIFKFEVFNQAVGEWSNLGLLPSSYYTGYNTKLRLKRFPYISITL